MPATFQLRTPSLNDLGALTELGRATFVETFGDLYTPEDLHAFLTGVYSEKSVSEELNNPDLQFQVLTQEEELVGFAKIGPVHVPAENPAPSAMELWQLYVRQEFLGQGLGKKLMAWAEEQFALRKAPEVYVSVFSENERAIRFYESHGFKKIGEYGFPVGDQIDLEWIMHKIGSSRK
ncbi:GNAT family N-acetyltransferase [bacterium]|jgi:ribosomal protein S18 acetylase RimI-like enzyme|nr:GNAT family N-acetyltransferase [bacterium]